MFHFCTRAVFVILYKAFFVWVQTARAADIGSEPPMQQGWICVLALLSPDQPDGDINEIQDMSIFVHFG